MKLESRLRSLIAPLLIVAGCITAASGFRVSAAANLSLLTSASLLVSLGVRHVRCHGVGLTAIFPVFFGVLIFASLFYLYLSQIRFFESGIELARPIDLETMNANADSILSDPATPPERRSFVSRMRAHMVYVQTGKIMPVYNESGSEAPFEPSEADLESRNAHQQLRTLVPLGAERSRNALYLLAATFAISTLLGLATPVRRTAV
jgi:hypothetical protein